MHDLAGMVAVVSGAAKGIGSITPSVAKIPQIGA